MLQLGQVRIASSIFHLRCIYLFIYFSNQIILGLITLYWLQALIYSFSYLFPLLEGKSYYHTTRFLSYSSGLIGKLFNAGWINLIRFYFHLDLHKIVSTKKKSWYVRKVYVWWWSSMLTLRIETPHVSTKQLIDTNQYPTQPQINITHLSRVIIHAISVLIA